jgi:hypothetical protein
MRLMKVIDNIKNILIEGVQHSVESRLIEVMNMKKLPIQSGSRVSLIQM